MRRQLKQQTLAFQELLLEMPESLTSAAGSFRPEVVLCIGSDVTPAEAALMNLEQVPIIIITDPVQESASIELLAAGAEDYLLFGHLERLKNVVARSVNSYRWQQLPKPAKSQQEPAPTNGQYRILFQGGPLPNWIFDKKTYQILDVNEAAIQHYGYSREEFLSMTLMDLRPREMLPEFFDRLDKAQTDMRDFWVSHSRHLKKDGTLIDVEIFGFNLEFQNRLCALVICQDITDREAVFEKVKQAEQEARKAFQEKETILESIGDAFYAIDPDWKVTYWNQQSGGLLGVSREEILGQDLRELFPDAGDFFQHYYTAIAEKRDLTFEEYFERTQSWYEVTVYPSAAGLSVYFRDITPRKNAELQLRQLNRDLQHYAEELLAANKGMEQFSYIVSHNLRAPVANILGLGDMLRQEGLLPELKERLQEELVTSVGRLDMVISDLNSILETKGEIGQKKELVDLQQLVDAICSGIDDLIQKQQVQLLTDFSERKHFHTLKTYLYSIFQNLIFNSIKYRHPDRPPRIEIATRKMDGKVLLSFRDNGLGIDLARRGDQVFGMYKRFHNHVEGKGMGLYMVKTQVELLGGKISVQSEVNKGTEFLLEFPLDKALPNKGSSHNNSSPPGFFPDRS